MLRPTCRRRSHKQDIGEENNATSRIMGIIVVQHRALATGPIDGPQSSINTIDPANTPLILVAQDRVIEASRIASQHVLQILSVALLDLTYHPIVDIKGIAKAPTHVSQVSSSNHTHATRGAVH